MDKAHTPLDSKALAARAVELARELIRFESVNPPGGEAACVGRVAELLEAAGMRVETHSFAEGRPSIVATAPGRDGRDPLCFTGHLDVVPVGAAPWSVPPFEARIEDGRLYGRGSSDMKSGVAAFVTATLGVLAQGRPLDRALCLIVTSGEETACQGALFLARQNALPRAALLVVAEPTSNDLVIAHKGSLRVRISTSGETAHSAMPDLGVNAIDALSPILVRMAAYDFGRDHHPLLGSTTACITTVTGGQNINSVPDAASFTVDFRTIPSRDHARLLAEVREVVGPGADIEIVSDLPGFSTAPDEPALSPLVELVERRAGGAATQPAGLPYFTDASALVPGMGGVPCAVIGPGEPAQCHRTDEFCTVDRIEAATLLYAELIGRYCQ